jgi:hypothetical protein
LGRLLVTGNLGPGTSAAGRRELKGLRETGSRNTAQGIERQIHAGTTPFEA